MISDFNVRKNNIKNIAAQEKRHWVRITYACNNSCLFCLDKENNKLKNIDFDTVRKDLLSGFNSGIKRAVISGGDPTVHPDLFRIIREAKKIGYKHVQLISNGRMLAYEKFATDLKKAGLDEVTLSLHSHVEKDFEILTGAKGSYKQSIAGLINAQKQGFIVSVDIVINKINIKRLKKTLLFFIELGVSEFDLLYPIPFGNAWDNRDKLFFSPEKSAKYLKEAFSLSKNNDLFIWTNRMPAKYLEGFEDLIQDPIKIFDEIRGRKKGFNDLIEKGKPMHCKGERCQYCFLKDFCRDLDEILLNKTIESKSMPNCLLTTSLNNEKVIKKFKFSKNFSIEDFTDFFIKNRYFVKSLRCEKCEDNKNCAGIWIEEVRNRGFSILNPK